MTPDTPRDRVQSRVAKVNGLISAYYENCVSAEDLCDRLVNAEAEAERLAALLTEREPPTPDLPAIQAVIEDMAAWRTSGMGGQTAMALDHWVQRLRDAVRVKPPTPDIEICICAAVRTDDGTVFRGHRHGDAMQTAVKHGYQPARADQQGFITSRNRYVGREKGRTLQDAAGILSADPKGYRGHTLFSEDLYLTPALRDAAAKKEK